MVAERAIAWLERQPWLAVAVTLLGAAMIAVTFDPRVSRGGDNALYFALARSLAETGTYRNLVAPGEPFETSVPWGYPLLLALWMRVLGAGYGALTLVSAVAMLVALVAVFRLLEADSPAWAALVVGVVCLDPLVIEYASKLLTEAPYMATSFTALALARRGRSVAAISTLAAVSYLIRPIGVALVVALFAWLGAHRRWRDLVVATPFVVLVAGSWHLRTLLVPSEGENLYVRYFLLESKYQTTAVRVDALGLVARFADNVGTYATEILPRLAIGSDDAWAVGALLVALVAVGFWTSARRMDLTHFFLPLQLGAVFLWLPESADVRYLVVVFPLLLWFALLGARALGERVSGQGALAGFGLLGCLSLVLMDRLTWVLPRAHEIQRGLLAGDTLAGKPAAERSFVELCRWLAEHSDPDAVVASRKARLVWYYADRKAVDLPPTAVPGDLAAFFQRHDVAYVVIDSLPTTNGRTRDRLGDAVRDPASHLVPVFETAHGDSIVRFVP
jgi:hypothetical protein